MRVLHEKESIVSNGGFYSGDKGTWTGNMFDVDMMYRIVQTLAEEHHMEQTLRALPFAREKHDGQFRKGAARIPYICHPLMMACHAKALGFREDDLFAAILLHDVLEDCPVSEDELPVGPAAREAVVLLTKDEEFYNRPRAEAESAYYAGISGNRLAILVKMLDRVNNVSGMASGFTKKRLGEYIAVTEEFFYPMIEKARQDYPEYASVVFLIRYHMISVVESLRSQMQMES